MMLTALGLLGFGVSMAYSLYKDLESTVREAQDAYAQEQDKSQILSQKTEQLLKAVDQGLAREKQLRENQQAVKDDKVRLEAEISNLEASVVRWQTAYSTEQAKTKKLTETAKDLLGVMEQAQTRLKSLEEGLKETQKVNTRLDTKNKKLEVALKRWQTSHAAEQSKNRMLKERADKLTKIAEKAEDRVHNLEQAEIGRRVKRDIEREWEEKSKSWGTDLGRSFKFIFF